MPIICMEHIQNKERVESREFLLNREHQSLILRAIHTAIALRAAWHITQKQDQTIDTIVLSSIIQIIKNDTISLELVLAISKRVLYNSKQIYEAKRTHILEVANEAFASFISLNGTSEKITAIHTTRDAVLTYLQTTI